MKRLLVLGGSGTLGRRVIRLVRRVLPDVEVVAATRTATAVPGSTVQRIDLRDPADVAMGCRGASLVVNAVGPYDYDPSGLIEACVAAGTHYADLAEPPPFHAAVREAATRAGAEAAGVCVVSGASTVPGLLQRLAGVWATRKDLASVDAWLALGSRNAVGAGLLAGLLAPLGRSGGSGARYFAGLARHKAGDGELRHFGRYPSGFAGDRMTVGDRTLPLRFFVGFDRTLLTRGLAAAAPVLGALPPGVVAGLSKVARPVAGLARPFGTPRGSLRIEARDGSGAIIGRVSVVAERDGLDVPAAPPVWMARRLHEGASLPAGARDLAEVLTQEEAVAGLIALGCRVEGMA